ncbi:hypothetical protein COY90_03200 [Candidatus Roizmanbacteria bacterium CG_4_10_14_0_8_um_filter_39_9]|uniref:NAD-dependent epimerase/dehydratase domain-containing protein n=1 Tax=Candidatus Roizmanbacteria bacterium CG_4_10_14_0_8_um_filter_39_9 TaxID=1974829 RepID=A0A2M7QCK8_9BACT|nr:MAG: hypothetical protein COY90_03200 [Candidatus Roizmanbacteria bacterium CG_4_10_14_0_8_um_filter_39_9]
MKILVTGSKGFLGSAFVQKYKSDYEIVHIDISKAKKILGYKPENPQYTQEQFHSSLKDKINLMS